MRRIVNIFTAAILLILLLVESGGVSVATCACSGKKTIVMLHNDGCCPNESNCMTITTIHLPDGVQPAHYDSTQLMPAVVEMQFLNHFPVVSTSNAFCRFLEDDYTPPGILFDMVMRV